MICAAKGDSQVGVLTGEVLATRPALPTPPHPSPVPHSQRLCRVIPAWQPGPGLPLRRGGPLRWRRKAAGRSMLPLAASHKQEKIRVLGFCNDTFVYMFHK